MEVNLLLVGKYGRLKSSFWISSRSRNEQPKRNILIQLNLAFSWWGLLIHVCSSWFLAPWLLWDTDKTCGCLAGVDAGKHLLPCYGSLTTSAMTSLPHSRVSSVENIQDRCSTTWVQRTALCLVQCPHLALACPSSYLGPLLWSWSKKILKIRLGSVQEKKVPRKLFWSYG